MKHTKKILALALAAAMSLSLFGCGGGSGSGGSAATPAPNNGGGSSTSGGDDGKVYEIIYAGTVTDTNPITIAFNWMAEELETRTNGRMKMTLYPNNTLGDTRANIESMQNNSVQIGEGSSAPLAIFTQDFMPMSLPFFFASYENAYNFAESDFMAQLADKMAQEVGVRPVGWMLNGARCLSNSKTAVSKPEDMKGLKIRVMENDIYIKTFEALGASPTAMSFAEVFTALQQGTVDGQDNPSNITNTSKFYEVQKYFTDLYHCIDLAPVMVSEEWYQSLPADLKETFDAVVAETIAYQRKLSQESEAADLEVIGTTCEITHLTEEQRQVFKDTCQPVYDWFATQYPDLDLQAYMDEAAKDA